MASIPPLSQLPTIANITVHGTGQAPSVMDYGPSHFTTQQPDDGATVKPGTVSSIGGWINGAVKDFMAFHDAINAWAAKSPADFYGVAAAAAAAGRAWSQYGSQITAAVQKYGSAAGAVVTGLANGTLKVVGGVLEGVGGDLVPPVIIDPSTLNGINNAIASLGGPGSLGAQAFAAGVTGVAGSLFNGVG